MGSQMQMGLQANLGCQDTGRPSCVLQLHADLGVALHHDVVDVRLQRHADVLALLGVKLEDVQHASHAHLEEHSLAAAAKLHDIAQLCRVQVLLGHRPEEVHPPLVDAQDELGRQQADGVLNAPHREEDGVPCVHGVSFQGLEFMTSSP